MTDKADIWTAVKARYDSAGLLTLTNIRDRSANSVDDTVGTEAAAGTLALWNAYAEVAFNVAEAMHLECAVRGTIALLWERGGGSNSIAKVKWDEVFTSGVIDKLKATSPRGRQSPSSNSGVQQRAETINGQPVHSWSSREALPTNYLPNRTIAR